MDISQFTEPIKKLIDVISSGIGIVYEPRRIRKKADADVYRIEQEAIANAKKLMIEGEAKITIIERAKKRLVHEEFNKQINIENIAEKSMGYLNEANTVSDPVDQDWIARYFDAAKFISNEEAQEIWAKILATEVERPNTISLRTIESLKNMTSIEAQVFTKLCKIVSPDGYVIHIDDDVHDELIGITKNSISELKDAGLIKPSHLAGVNVNEEPQAIYLGQKQFNISADKKFGKLIKAHVLTKVGLEIQSIMELGDSDVFEKRMISILRDRYNFRVEPTDNKR